MKICYVLNYKPPNLYSFSHNTTYCGKFENYFDQNYNLSSQCVILGFEVSAIFHSFEILWITL